MGDHPQDEGGGLGEAGQSPRGSGGDDMWHRGENREDAGGAGRDVVTALDSKKPEEEEPSSGADNGV